MSKNLAQDFNEWMANMGNIHYTDDEKMAKAFQIIEDYEEV
jgi:hypothetical protein